MRILLFVEPFAIRDTLTHFEAVARDFLPLLSPPFGYDIRIFANNATFDVLKKEIEAHAPKLIRSTPTEEDYLRDRLKLPWVTEGMPVWCDLMAGKGEVSEWQLEMLRRIWNLFPFEIIVHWGENGAITRFLEERPVTRVAMELGCTRPPFFNSMVMDPFGTNGSAIIPKLRLEDIRSIIEDRPMSRHYALLGYSSDISAPAYGMQFAPLVGELDRKWAGRRIAYLPLQLFDDANLLRFSPYDTLTDVVLDVVPRLADAGYLTIIKPHPASKHRKGSLYENQFARGATAPWASSVFWCSEEVTATNAQFFNLADVVVTVNSSVGFEALYYDKPVVVLGDAVYKPQGIFPLLDDIILGTFDRDTYLEAIGLLRRFVLGGYLQPHTLRSNADNFCQRVGLIHQCWQARQGDPVAFARDYWRACAPTQEALARSSMFYGISRPGVIEFGTLAVPAQPKAARDRSSAVVASESSRLPASSIARLASLWAAYRAGEWIKANWTTDAGRAEVVHVGRIVDADYYLDMYPDVRDAGVDPIKHFINPGMNEGRRPRAHIPGGSSDSLLDNLLDCVNRWGGGSTQPESAHDVSMPDETAPYQAIFHRVREHVQAFESGSLREWLAEAWADQQMRAKIIEIGKIVSPEYYLARYPDLAAAAVDPTAHYAWTGINEGRSPRVGLAEMGPDALLDLLLATCDQADKSLALHEYLLTEDQQNLRENSLAAARAATATTSNRVAVVAHLYYTDLVPEILERLRAIEEPFDFYVTLPDWGTRQTQELVRAAYPDAIFYPAANRGRDIGPFMDLLPVLIAKNYDAVLKVQTKRGYFRAGKMVRAFGEIWRHEAFDALIGSSERVADILEAFRSNIELSAVGPQPFLLSLDAYPYDDEGVLAESILGANCGHASMFFAGTMFWVRPSSLRDVTRINLTHFAVEDGANDGALAHLVERMFGEAFTRQGGILAVAPIDPTESLNFEPVAQAMKLDAYFSERQKSRGVRGLDKNNGVLIW